MNYCICIFISFHICILPILHSTIWSTKNDWKDDFFSRFSFETHFNQQFGRLVLLLFSRYLPGQRKKTFYFRRCTNHVVNVCKFQLKRYHFVDCALCVCFANGIYKLTTFTAFLFRICNKRKTHISRKAETVFVMTMFWYAVAVISVHIAVHAFTIFIQTQGMHFNRHTSSFALIRRVFFSLVRSKKKLIQQLLLLFENVYLQRTDN